MHVTNLQYLMGHSDATVTMNVYTHPSYDSAKASLDKIIHLQQWQTAEVSG